jgi:hypothetical protein
MYPDTDLQYSHGMGIMPNIDIGGDGNSSTVKNSGDHGSTSTSQGLSLIKSSQFEHFLLYQIHLLHLHTRHVTYPFNSSRWESND